MKYIRMLWAEFGYGTVISTMMSVPLLSPGPSHLFGSSRLVRLIPTRYCFQGHGNMPSGGNGLPGVVVPVRSCVSNARLTLFIVNVLLPDLIAITNLPRVKLLFWS